MPVPGRCTPPPATARRTSRSASSTGCPVVNPVGNDGRFLAGTGAGSGTEGLGRQPGDLGGAGGQRPAAARGIRAPQLSALLAPQDPGHLPRHAAVVHQHGAAEAARAHPARHQGSAVDPCLGRAAHRRHDRDTSGLVHLAPAHLGRADPAVRAQAHRGAASAHPGADPAGRGARGGGRHRCLVRAQRAGAAGRRCGQLRQGHRRHGRVGRLGHVLRVRRP